MSKLSLPKVEEPVSGVWALPVPFPNPLVYTYCYAIEGDDGVIVIDAGWDSDDAWDSFQGALSVAGFGLGDIRGVLITHIHPDHYGLAERLRNTTDAWIGMHALEAQRIPGDERQMALAVDELVDWLRQVGAPDTEIERLHDEGPRIRSRMSMVRPDVLLSDEQAVPAAGHLTAIHTPGHTPGHLCFHDSRRQVVFTGDHVLPRVTPNVSKRPQMGEDPLGDFVRSLAKIRGLDARLGLPGHEWSIDDLGGRIGEITRHHHTRMGEVEAVVRSGADTIWDVARLVRWSIVWEDMPGLIRRSAIGEAHAHLDLLAREGKLRRVSGVPDRWTPANGAGTP